MEKNLQEMFERAKVASRELALTDDKRKRDLLGLLADAILTHKDAILSANALDLSRMDRANPLYDRLLLDEKRLAGIASDMSHQCAVRCYRHHLRGAPQCQFRRVLSMLQERQCLCAERRSRCR